MDDVWSVIKGVLIGVLICAIVGLVGVAWWQNIRLNDLERSNLTLSIDLDSLRATFNDNVKIMNENAKVINQIRDVVNLHSQELNQTGLTQADIIQQLLPLLLP